MQIKSIIHITMMCLFSVCSITVSQASTILGTANLNITDDLTIIKTDDGNVQEWLDISATDGMSATSAVATYAADGFRFATSSEVSGMFNAFSLPAFAAPSSGSGSILDITVDDFLLFRSYFGTTNDSNDGSLAWFDSPTDLPGYNSYVCLGTVCSNSGGFVRSLRTGDSNPVIGVFLVRDVSAVPVPAATWLFGSGLIGLIAIARRKKS